MERIGDQGSTLWTNQNGIWNKLEKSRESLIFVVKRNWRPSNCTSLAWISLDFKRENVVAEGKRNQFEFD